MRTCKPASHNHSHATSIKQPAASSQQPATSNQQPATSNQQPATSNQQPAISKQQPSASKQQPATSNQQQETSNKQHATSNFIRCRHIYMSVMSCLSCLYVCLCVKSDQRVNMHDCPYIYVCLHSFLQTLLWTHSIYIYIYIYICICMHGIACLHVYP